MQFGNAIAGILSNHRQLTEARIRQARELAVRNRELDIQQRLAQARVKLLGQQGELAEANTTLAQTRTENTQTEGKILDKELGSFDERFAKEQELLDQQTDAQRALAESRRAQAQAEGQASAASPRGLESDPDARTVYTTTSDELQAHYQRMSEIDTLLEGIMASPELDEYATARANSLRKEKQMLMEQINRKESLNQSLLNRMGMSSGTTQPAPGAGSSDPQDEERISTGVDWNTNN